MPRFKACVEHVLTIQNQFQAVRVATFTYTRPVATAKTTETPLRIHLQTEW